MEGRTSASPASTAAARTVEAAPPVEGPPSSSCVPACGQLQSSMGDTPLTGGGAARGARAGAGAGAVAAAPSDFTKSWREQSYVQEQEQPAEPTQQRTSQCAYAQQQEHQLQRQPHQRDVLQRRPFYQQQRADQQHNPAEQSFHQQQCQQQTGSQQSQQAHQQQQPRGLRDAEQHLKEGGEPSETSRGDGQCNSCGSLPAMTCASSDTVTVPRHSQHEANLPTDQRAAGYAATFGLAAGTCDLTRVAAARSASSSAEQAAAVTPGPVSAACGGAATIGAAAPAGFTAVCAARDGECSPLGVACDTPTAAGESRFNNEPSGRPTARSAAGAAAAKVEAATAALATLGAAAGAARAAAAAAAAAAYAPAEEAVTSRGSSVASSHCFPQVKQERSDSRNKKTSNSTAAGIWGFLGVPAVGGSYATIRSVRAAKAAAAGIARDAVADAVAALPDWVRELGEVYRRYLVRQLSLQGALKALQALLQQAAATATDGGDSSEQQQQPPDAITFDRLLEAIFRQVLHLCAAGLPKQSDREAARLSAFFYRVLATVDELTWQTYTCSLGQEDGQQAGHDADQQEQGERKDNPLRQVCLGGISEEPERREEANAGTGAAAAAAAAPSAIPAASGNMRYRSIESLWGRLLQQVESAGCPVNVRLGICCFLLHLLRWGCSSSICVAEALQQQHRDVLLQVLDHAPEAALRRLALLLLEHFQVPERSCRVWKAFLMHLNDEAPPVRRAAVTRLLLVDFPIARDTVEQAERAVKLLLVRMRDASAEVRAAVYKRLSTCELCLSVENRALVALTGLSDKAKSVREACSRMLRFWLVQREQLLAAAGAAAHQKDPPTEPVLQHQQTAAAQGGEQQNVTASTAVTAAQEKTAGADVLLPQTSDGADAVQQEAAVTSASQSVQPKTTATAAGEKRDFPEDSNPSAASSHTSVEEAMRKGPPQEPGAAAEHAAGALAQELEVSEQQQHAVQQQQREAVEQHQTRAVDQQQQATEQPEQHQQQQVAVQETKDQAVPPPQPVQAPLEQQSAVAQEHTTEEKEPAAREAVNKCERPASYKKLAASALHALVNDYMEFMPLNEAALDVILRELLSVYPAECHVECLKQILKEGAESLRALTPAGLFILRVYVQHLASEAERCRLSIPDLQQMLLRLLAAGVERQQAVRERAPAVDAGATTVAEAFEFYAATEKALLTLCICARQLLLLACCADVVEEEQARLLDEACEQLLLRMPLMDCLRLLTNNLHPLELQVASYAAPPAAAAASGSKGGVLGTNSILGSALWPGYWMRCMVPAACMQLLVRLQRVLKRVDVSSTAAAEKQTAAFDTPTTGAASESHLGAAGAASGQKPAQRQQRATFGSRMCSVLAELREPFEARGEKGGERDLAHIVDTMEPSVEDVRALCLNTFPLEALQEQHDVLLQKLLALRHKAGDLTVEAYGMRRKQKEQEQEPQPPQGNEVVDEASKEKARATNAQMLEALEQQICLMQREWHRSALLVVVIDNALQDRWFRIICLLDSFFAQGDGTSAVESALSQMPCSMLLPGLQFYCNAEDVQGFCFSYCCCDVCLRPENAEGEPPPPPPPDTTPPYGWCWKEKHRHLLALQLGVSIRPPLYNDLCEVLVTKSLGCFCLLSWKEREVARQLKAYHVSLLTSLGELQSCATSLQQLHIQREYQETRRRRLQERLERQERRIEQLQQRLQQQEEEEKQQQQQQRPLEQEKERTDGDTEEKQQQPEDTVELSSQGTGSAPLPTGPQNTAAAAAAVEQQLERLRAKAKATVAECDATVHALGMTQAEIDQLQRSFAPHLLRSELYCCFLGDLLLCHPRLLRKEVLKQRSLLDELLQKQFERGDAPPPAPPAAAESCSSGVAAAAADAAAAAAIAVARRQQASPNRQLALPRRAKTGAAGESPLARRSTTRSSAAEGEDRPACLLDLLWQVVTAEEPATKSLQVTCLHVLLKVLVLPLVEDELMTGIEKQTLEDEGDDEDEEQEEQMMGDGGAEVGEGDGVQQQLLKQQQRQQRREKLQQNLDAKKRETPHEASPALLERILGNRLRILMEVVYLQPVLSTSLNDVLAYVDSLLLWGYPSQQKLRSFYVLQCFTCSQLPAAAARGALTGFYFAARYMAAHGLRAIFHLHLTYGASHKQQQQADESRSAWVEYQVMLNVAAMGAASRYCSTSMLQTGKSPVAALTGGSCSITGRRDRQPGQQMAEDARMQQSAMLPSLLRMLEDYKKLLLFVISVFRAAALSAANKAATGAGAGAGKGGDNAEQSSGDVLQTHSDTAKRSTCTEDPQPDAAAGSDGQVCESNKIGSDTAEEEGGGGATAVTEKKTETAEEEEDGEEGTARDISLKTFELLAVLFLAAEQHMVPLMVLQPRLRFFEAVAAAVSAWLLQQGDVGGGSVKSQQQQPAGNASASPNNNAEEQDRDGNCSHATSPKRRQRQQQGGKTNTKQDTANNSANRKMSLLELSFADEEPLPGLRLVLVAKALLCDLLAKARDPATAAAAAVAVPGAAAAATFANSQKKVVKDIGEVLEMIGRTEQALLCRVMDQEREQQQRDGGEELERRGVEDELLRRGALLQEEEESSRALAEQMRQTYLDELERYEKAEAQTYVSPLLTYSSQALAGQLHRLQSHQEAAQQTREMLAKGANNAAATDSEQDEEQEEGQKKSAEGETEAEKGEGQAGRALPPRRCRAIAAERMQQQLVRSNRKRSKREADKSSSEAEEEGAAEPAATQCKSSSTRKKSGSGQTTSEQSSESSDLVDSSSESCFSDTGTESEDSGRRTSCSRRRPRATRAADSNRSSTPVRSRRRTTKDVQPTEEQQQQRGEAQRQPPETVVRGRGGGGRSRSRRRYV